MRFDLSTLPEDFWDSRSFKWFQEGFWVTFIVLPLVTGLLSYRWLPNESYDSRRHDLVESHEADDGDQSKVVADVWRSKATGELFDREQFTGHRRHEALRMGLAWFSYGLIGCFFFAAVRKFRDSQSFLRSFRNAVILDLVVAIITWGSIHH